MYLKLSHSGGGFYLYREKQPKKKSYGQLRIIK